MFLRACFNIDEDDLDKCAVPRWTEEVTRVEDIGVDVAQVRRQEATGSGTGSVSAQAPRTISAEVREAQGAQGTGSGGQTATQALGRGDVGA